MMAVGDRRVRVRWKRDGEYACPGSSQTWRKYVGDEAVMIERHWPTQPVRYWTDYDIDLAYIVGPDDVEVVEVIQP